MAEFVDSTKVVLKFIDFSVRLERFIDQLCKPLMIDPNSVKGKEILDHVDTGSSIICVVLYLAKLSTARMPQPRKFDVSLVSEFYTKNILLLTLFFHTLPCA